MKLKKLKRILTDMQSLLVAFSGGVDSTFLLKVAAEVLGDRVLAATAASEFSPAHEIDDARRIAQELSVRHRVLEHEALTSEVLVRNPPDRCYHCKKELFTRLIALARTSGLSAVADGTNYDDSDDFRPGMRALAELGIRSPLKEAGLTKDDIRRLSRQYGLATWDRPSLACLASRFPYGTRITRRDLQKVDSAESYLRQCGLKQLRVRHHTDTARIELLPGDMHLLMDEKTRRRVLAHFRNLGYIYVTLDLEGYRTGSLNEVLANE